MPCPIKLVSESKEDCLKALEYWYDVKLADSSTMNYAKNLIDQYDQVKKHLEQAFNHLE